MQNANLTQILYSSIKNCSDIIGTLFFNMSITGKTAQIINMEDKIFNIQRDNNTWGLFSNILSGLHDFIIRNCTSLSYHAVSNASNVNTPLSNKDGDDTDIFVCGLVSGMTVGALFFAIYMLREYVKNKVKNHCGSNIDVLSKITCDRNPSTVLDDLKETNLSYIRFKNSD